VTVCLPLDKLLRVLERHLREQRTAVVKWKHKVVEIEHGDDEGRVVVETPEGRKTLSADYVLGCDGVTSQVRRSLFGENSFPGETLHSQLVATNVSFHHMIS